MTHCIPSQKFTQYFYLHIFYNLNIYFNTYYVIGVGTGAQGGYLEQVYIWRSNLYCGPGCRAAVIHAVFLVNTCTI